MPLKAANMAIIEASPAFQAEVRKRTEPLVQEWIKSAKAKGHRRREGRRAEFREELSGVAAGSQAPSASRGVLFRRGIPAKPAGNVAPSRQTDGGDMKRFVVAAGAGRDGRPSAVHHDGDHRHRRGPERYVPNKASPGGFEMTGSCSPR